MEPLTLEPIGVIHNNVADPVDANWNSVLSEIHIQPELIAGLKGLTDWSHVLVVYVMHQARFDATMDLVRRPRGLAEMPEVGIFAQRARHRPNRIGITAVKLLGVNEGVVHVRGLDAIDGTPVVDLKPYAPVYDGAYDPLVPAWFLQMMQGYF